MKKITFALPVYTFQIDFAGIVSNIVYIEWMEIGRMKLLETVGMLIHEIQQDGIAPVLTHTTIDYKRPFRLGHTVHAELWLSELRNTSATLEHRFYNQDGTLMAAGRQRGLFVKRDTLRPHWLTSEERARFEPYLATDPDEG